MLHKQLAATLRIQLELPCCWGGVYQTIAGSIILHEAVPLYSIHTTKQCKRVARGHESFTFIYTPTPIDLY